MKLATQQTMSSREIAELTGKRHDNVMRTINDLCYKDLILPQFEESISKSNGQTQTVAMLNKRDSLVLVARLSPEFTAAIVDRWQELEAKQLDTPELQMAKGLIAAQQMIENANKQIAEMKPKVEYHDRVLATDNCITTTEIAAELGMSARKLNDILAQMKVQRKIGNRWVLTAANLNKGYDVEVTHVDDGGKSRHAMKWSEKGRKFIHELMEG